nr:LOG family protein [Angustibacter aerolatus]
MNEFVDLGINFRYFFARKTMFVKYAEGFVVLPGGFGTFDEPVRGAHAGADPQGHLVPDRARRVGVLAGAARLAALVRTRAGHHRRGRPRPAHRHRRRRRGRADHRRVRPGRRPGHRRLTPRQPRRRG